MNMQLDGMNTERQLSDNIYNNNIVFSITSRIGKVCIETTNLSSYTDSCFI